MLEGDVSQEAPPRPTNPFLADEPVSLALVLERARRETNGTRRRDLDSAFRFVAERMTVELSTTPATAKVLRGLFAERSAAALGVTPRRLDNIRSIVTKAAERFGPPRQRVTRMVELAPDWIALLTRIERKEYRSGLSRLASYCSANAIAPQDVKPTTLIGLHAALDEESLVKDPRKLIKHTIALWNMSMRSVPGWPQLRLASPFIREPKALPLDRFALSFQADIGRWEEAMLHPDPFDLGGPIKALRPTTVEAGRLKIRTFASVLVRQGIVAIEELSGLADLFEGDRVQKGLKTFLTIDDEGRQKTTAVAFRMAERLLSIGRDYLRLDVDRVDALRVLTKRLDPKAPRVMGERSRRRIEQFDEDEAKQRLLRYPEQHAYRAMLRKSPLRRARTFEQALAASLTIFTCLRIENLRKLRPDRHIKKTKTGLVISIEADEVKNSVPIERALPPEAESLLQRFVADHRPQLQGHEGPYLFPGKDGGPKSDNAMRRALADPIRKHTGIDLTPHTIRHAAGKILVDEDPTLIAAVSQMLGHKSIDTTITNYIGGQSRAAGRKLASILRTVRDAERTKKRG